MKIFGFALGVLAIIFMYVVGIILGGLLWGTILYLVFKIIGVSVLGGYLITFQLTFVVGIIFTIITNVLRGGKNG